MPGAGTAEIYFIGSMMALILLICGVAVFFFVRQYKKEMKDKRERTAAKAAEKTRVEKVSEAS